MNLPEDTQDHELGEYELGSGLHGTLDITARRKRQQNQIFDDWHRRQAAATDFTHVKTSRHDNDKQEVETIKALLSQRESRHIIGSPHAFQTELFERAKTQNTVVVADTGSGKTLVSMLLLNHIMDNELESRAAGQHRKVAFFVVEKVALMYQQWDTLQANLRYAVAPVSGHNNPRLWDESKWEDLFQKHDIIVCTAEILHQCLMRTFIKMENINLLIFDEAHHAKKGHPYARIMQEFYKDNPTKAHRPLIFGMTASPVDVQDKDELTDCTRELESLLQCKIATCSAEDMQNHSARPTEEVKTYPRCAARGTTKLYRDLEEKYLNLKGFNSLFERAKDITRRLGPWCGDAYWSFAFSDREAKRLGARAEKKLTIAEQDNNAHRSKLDTEIQQLHTAQEHIRNHQLCTPTATDHDLSTKVLALRDIFLRYFELPGETLCLVFTERRETARLLHLIFERLDLPHLKTGFLVGSSARDFEGQRNSFLQQQSTLKKFQKGTVNCLFATSVAEEGLDIPQCNVVVRFDPCRSVIQFIQSRGRARQKHSRFIHLLELHNQEQTDHLMELRDSEDILKGYCDALPRDRLLLSEDDTGEDDLLAEDEKYPTYTIKKTGAKLTYHFSLGVLHHYVNCIPRDEMDDMSVRYNTFVRDGKFVCEVMLPERAYISPVIGRPYARKMQARMSAAFEICILLRKQGKLSDKFLPTIREELHVMRNARVALKSKKQHAYDAQCKPSMWADDRGTKPEALFMTLLHLQQPWMRPTRPIALLTRRALPQLPSFPLHRLDGQTSMLEPLSHSEPINVDEDQLSKLTYFTLTIFKDVFNKKFEEKHEDMSYWLAPLTDADGVISTDAIDWKLLEALHHKERIHWKPGMAEERLVNRFIIDPFHGGRRLYTLNVVRDLNPLDPVPRDTAVGPWAKDATTIIEYSSSLWKKSKGKRTWNESQPVIQAEQILHRLNVLSTANEQERNFVSNAFICPEPLNISLLPTDVVAMALLFPAIIYRLENCLIALEFAATLGLNVRADRALEATTKDSDNSEDAEAEKLNFQRGMGPNYERLEFIGDTFLKMATTVATYLRNVGKDEYWMHADRLVLLCNVNMFNNAQNHGYVKYVRSKEFSRRTWYPDGLRLLEGKGANKANEDTNLRKQQLSEKTIADVCEAMIGAALVSHVHTGYEDLSCFDDAVKAVTAFVSSNEHWKHDMQCWDDYRKAYEPPKIFSSACSAAENDVAMRVEEIHDYHFKHPKLLTSAFTHPSMPRTWAKAPSYQRLEFLGDSLLDMTSVKYLFDSYPHKDPQWMTEHKMAMVSNKFLAALGAKLGFNKFLQHNGAAIQQQMKAYVDEFAEAQRESGNSRGFWQSLGDAPKALADMVEAYVGAMFIDSDFDFGVVQKFFDEHVRWFFEDMHVYDTFANNHPINRLREHLSTSMGCHGFALKAKEVVSDDEFSTAVLAAVMVHNSVIGQASAKTSRVAKIHAADGAYKELVGLAPFEFRLQYSCNCVAKEGLEAGEVQEYDDTAI